MFKAVHGSLADPRRLVIAVTAVFVVVVALSLLIRFQGSPLKVAAGAVGQQLSSAPTTSNDTEDWWSGFELSPKLVDTLNQKSSEEHIELVSRISPAGDGTWFSIDFHDHVGYNPNIIPHPSKKDTYIVVALRDKSDDATQVWRSELYCEARFENGTLVCVKSPLILPIGSTVSDLCQDDLDFFQPMLGPHDARIFYGPNAPYIIYGSQGKQSCLGQWLHDLRRLVEWDAKDLLTDTSQPFFWPTSLKRPPPVDRRIEKNWFVFWDVKGEMYLHYDVTPRSFANLSSNGDVGKDLAPLSAKHDLACMDKYMPKLNSPLEWIHQGTNSLSVTLCNRSSPDCKGASTYIFTIIQLKTFYLFHGIYEPYVMLFNPTSPFELHGLSSKPLWYSGRWKSNATWTMDSDPMQEQGDQLFTTSMSWKSKGRKYHGYLDDELFIAMGRGDSASRGLVVLAKDLLQDLAIC
ncbi:hypothetical protein D0860_02416 [Hortaea werneckii]|uniref:Uncharacterized protein n=1 Tax=Hortaea werneckii TaxID=91943 RepID=A0A3M7HKQ2_HORWE|nr:hypothetical protein D0860_02416 [Hortaea werneckii]